MAQIGRSQPCPLLGDERKRDFGTFRSIDDPRCAKKPSVQTLGRRIGLRLRRRSAVRVHQTEALTSWASTRGSSRTGRSGANSSAGREAPIGPAGSARRSQFAGEPAHRVRFQGIHRHRDLFGPAAGRAFERSHFEAALAGSYPHEHHPVFARRTHRPLVCLSDHDTLPTASYPMSGGRLQVRRLWTRLLQNGSIVGTAAAGRS
jgi:hypothetical protein